MAPLLTRRRLIRRARVANLHSSSRFDRSPLSLLEAARGYLLHHTWVSFTEVANDQRVASLAKFPLYRLCKVEGPGGRDECAALVRRSTWEVVSVEVVNLNEGTGVPSSGWHNIWALVVTTRHRWTRQVVKRLVAHLPAHVEGDKGFRRNSDVVAWKACIAKIKTLVKRWQADPAVDHVEITCDWNISYREQWVRTYIANQFPTLTCNWDGRLPEHGGTHGNERIIDFTLADYEFTETGLAIDDESSDHRPFGTTGLLRQLVAA